MTHNIVQARWALLLGASVCLTHALHAQTAPKLAINLQPGYAGITVAGAVNTAYAIQATTNLPQTNGWATLTNVVLPSSPWVYLDYASSGMAQRFYRVVGITLSRTNMVLVPAGSFAMGDGLSDSDDSWGERPVHTVNVSAFYMDRYEVTKALWDEVYTWAVAHGYSFDNEGWGKAANHPVYMVNWYDVVKWCNARSQKDGRVPAYYADTAQNTVYTTGQVSVQNDWVKWNAGYRLPTEAEWEKAARGGVGGRRFPWGNTIKQSQANYYAMPISAGGYDYDLNASPGYHPSYISGGLPYTSPVGSFASNGYGVYDMVGDVWEWSWDWRGSYSSGSQSDPQGPGSGSYRVLRGGGFGSDAFDCRMARRNSRNPATKDWDMGFRSVLPPGS